MLKDDRIRVVQFLCSTVRSGAEEVALELARGLDPKKFKSFVVCPPSLLDSIESECRAAGAGTLSLTLESPWQIGAARKFVSFLRSQRIDVVHAHMIRAALVAVPLSRLAGVPVVVQTCHGREAWRTGWLRRRYEIDRIIAAMADATIAVSESTRDYLLKEKGLNPRKVVVIRNGRSLTGFSPGSKGLAILRADLGIAPDEAVLGVFGRLEEQKGHCYLIEALPMVAAQARIKVLFVGDGSLRAQLEASAHAHGLEGRIVFTGYRQDWKDLMVLSDLVVLPSLYEGLPLVPIEAGALGKAVLATAVDGTREVVEDGLSGRLVPPAQPEPLTRALLELLQDPSERRRLGENARARAEELFSLERQLRETADLYGRLLAHSRPSLQKMAAHSRAGTMPSG
jgi:glycosyltransferase involved in cell wall biosynthesis